MLGELPGTTLAVERESVRRVVGQPELCQWVLLLMMKDSQFRLVMG